MSNSSREVVRTCSLVLTSLVFGCTSSSGSEDKPVLSDSVNDFPKVMLLVHNAAEGQVAMLSLALDDCTMDLAHVSPKANAPAQEAETDAQAACSGDDCPGMLGTPTDATPVVRNTYTCNEADLEKGRLLFSKDRVEALRNLAGDLRFSIIWPDTNTLDSFSVPRDSDDPSVKEVVEYLWKLDTSYWSAP